MADTKVSALTDGEAPQDTDLFPVARGAGNARLSWLQLRQVVVPPVTRLDVLRDVWSRRVAELQRYDRPQPNIGSVVYVDPDSPTNGTGTFASPRNVFPGFSNHQTVLLKEGTTGPAPTGISSLTNWLLGTYDAKTGRRVIDTDRLATIDAAAGQAVGMSGAQINTWVSGIRIVNYRQGVIKSANAAGAGGGIEYCVFESADDGGTMPIAIQTFVGGSVVRYNKILGINGDGIWCGQNLNTSSKGFTVYGNEVILGESVDLDGPDCIQLSVNVGESIGQWIVHTNWVSNRRNRKQCIIGTYSSTLHATDSFDVYNNVVLGADTSLPQIGPSAQNAIFSECPNTRIWGNYVENSRYPIVVSAPYAPANVNGSQIHHNVIMVDMVGLLRTAIEANSAAGSGVLTRICNNTIIGVACGGPELGGGVLPAISSLGPAEIRNNLIVGSFWSRTIQVNATNAGVGNLIVSPNAFDSRPTTWVFDSGAGARALTDGDRIGCEDWVDSLYRPLLSAPAVSHASPAYGQAVPDVYGTAPHGAHGSFGAIHPTNQVGLRQGVPLAQAVFGDITGPWIAPQALRFAARFACELAGGGTLTVTVQGKRSGALDSTAATVGSAASLGGGGGLEVLTAFDAAAHDLVRVVISGHSAHGRVDCFALAA